MVKDMAANNKFTHLTLDERRIIETGIRNGSTQKAIADILGKQKSTIGKEIKLHREQTYKCSLPVECAVYRTCRPNGSCRGVSCPDLVPFKCNRRDRSPGACNGCTSSSACRFSKYKYCASKAQQQYEETLKDSRSGVDLTSKEASAIADTIAPLLAKGQSPFTIIRNHPELNICERTLYSYIENGILRYAKNSVTQMDLRRQVGRRQRSREKLELKKREDRSFLVGRTYSDYLAYRAEHPELPAVQMDTVYNVQKMKTENKYIPVPPFIQTFKFPEYGFLFALYHTSFSAQEMKNGVDMLESILSEELFRKHVPILLTDRGPEFSAAESIERRNGDLRTRLYYCDPQASCQKGSLENNHIELRYVCPKHTDLCALGLTGQDKLNLVLSHINSTRKQHLHGKSPLEILQFMEPDLCKKFLDFGLQIIEGDKVILKPYLLK